MAEFHIEVVDIPHSEIEPNPDNPNEMDSKTLDALKEDIEKRGFVQPVLVRPIGEIAGEVPMHVATCPMTKPKPADRVGYDDDLPDYAVLVDSCEMSHLDRHPYRHES